MAIETATITEQIGGISVNDAQQMPTTVREFDLWLAAHPELADKNFEFVNGQIIEKTGMKQDEVFIARFLMQLFVRTQAFKNNDWLSAETDSHIDDKRKRIGDLTYLTAAQIEAAKNGDKVAASFLIEIISPNDVFGQIEAKIKDYFEADAKLVWYISTEQQQIYAYTSPVEVKIYRDDMEISAAPVLNDFTFKVEEMFE